MFGHRRRKEKKEAAASVPQLEADANHLYRGPAKAAKRRLSKPRRVCEEAVPFANIHQDSESLRKNAASRKQHARLYKKRTDGTESLWIELSRMGRAVRPS